MLNIIPTEVFINIFGFLGQSDKARLMLVSQRWYTIIRESTLLSDLVVEQKYVDSVVQMIENGIIDGAKVRRLVLKNQDYAFPLYHKLQASFPKVQTLVWKQPNWSSFDVPALSQEKVICKNSSIEIAGFEKCVHHLLENTTFTSLTSVTLHLYDKKSDTIPIQRTMSAFLKIPSLEKINLHGFSIDISQFESLHKALPKLSKINLSNVVFKSTLGHDLKKTWMTSSVKSFKVTGNSKMEDDDFTWIDYFSKKYANIVEFEFECYVPFCDDIRSSPNYFKVCQLMHSKLLSQFTANLTAYIVPNKPMGAEAFGHLFQKNNRLRTLKFEYNAEGEHAFSHLDHASVKELEITNCPSIMLPKMESLNTLVMGCDLNKNEGSVFYLDKLLTNCNAHHLEIQALYISIANAYPSTRLKSLTLKAHTLDNSVWRFISQCCPLLKTIELHLTSPDPSAIDLPRHSLHRITLRVKRGPRFYKLITNTDIRWFELKFGTGRVNEIPDCEYEWLEEQYFASIQCQSILHFDIKTC
jgi:hypothetical protein